MLRSLSFKLNELEKRYIVLFILIIIFANLLILPFIFIPLFNSELIWTSRICMIPEGCPNTEYITLPNNDLIQNKYDLIIFGAPNYTCFVVFEHTGKGLDYIINEPFNDEEGVIKRTLRMIPGNYRVFGDHDKYPLQLWEHGFISSDFESLYYRWHTFTVLFFIGSFAFVFMKRMYRKRRIEKRIRLRG